MDDRVHPAERVHLVGDASRLLIDGQIADHDRSALVPKVTHGCEPLLVADVDDHVVALLEERPGGVPSQTVGGAGDEDARDRSRSDLYRWRLNQTPPGPVQLNPSPQIAIALPVLVMQISP